MKTFIHILCAGIFWIWNTCFLLLVYFALLPLVGWGLLVALGEGRIPLPFIVSLFGLLLIPPICTALGAWRLRKHPVLLMRLFYGIEVPLFGLCLLRMFVLRETTPASTFVLTVAALAIATFAVELFFGYAAYRKPLAWFQMVTHSLVLMVGLYVGGILLFYTVPAIGISLYSFLQFGWVQPILWALAHDPLGSLMMVVLWLFFIGFSCTLFLAMPYVLVNIYLHSWGRIFSGFGRQYGWWKGSLVTGGVAIATLLLFVQTQTQPQTKAFALLDNPPRTPVEQQALLQESDTIQAGLVNAYLHAYRYLSPWEDSNALGNWYQSLFNLSPDQAQFWQNWHNRFFSPFLYQGSQADAARAAELYAQFFDEPIQQTERQAIQHALESTVNREETKAGLLNIDQKIVYLARQEVTVEEQGDWAEVTVYERYENNTWQDQEIFYAFSLPESAVVTGLWLGDDVQPHRFRFVVSPRGAAQQVYNEEVERGQRQPAVDPALLEQVGPRQYRLRIFPIPQQVNPKQPGRTHLWLTYKVMAQEGEWPLPQLTERRSVFWTPRTAHLRRGESVELAEDQWFESGIPVRQSSTPQTHQVTLAGFQVKAEPINQAKRQLKPQALHGKHIAVMVDTSRSMAQHQKPLTQTVQALDSLSRHNRVDWMMAAAGAPPQRLESKLDAQTVTYFGSLQLADMLQQLEQLQTDRPESDQPYDAILLITDEGSYELAEDEISLAQPSAPLWILHLGGKLPKAYQDQVLQSIQDSHGGIATNLETLWQQWTGAFAADPTLISIADGYQWQVSPEAPAAAGKEQAQPSRPTILAADAQEFQVLAARQLIQYLSRTTDMATVDALDRVHGIATSAEIVSPYSSMLVLVNDEQRERLRQAELADDRFDRQVEDGTDQLTEPNNPLSNPTAVPEPGTPLALVLVAGGWLIWQRRQRRTGV